MSSPARLPGHRSSWDAVVSAQDKNHATVGRVRTTQKPPASHPSPPNHTPSHHTDALQVGGQLAGGELPVHAAIVAKHDEGYTYDIGEE